MSLIICPTCGKYRVGGSARTFLESVRDPERMSRFKLSHFMRSVSDRAYGKRDNSFFPAYSTQELQDILSRPKPAIEEKLRMLLEYLGSITAFPGELRTFDIANDYVVLCAENISEANFHLNFLASEELVSLSRVEFGAGVLIRFMVTGKGWRELEKLKKIGADSFDGFIAMSFDESRDRVHDAIEAAIRSAGYTPIRVDRVEHLNRIDDEIIARIRRSKFMVADLTKHRAGVYFEAGFMLGLGRPVIWICEKTDLRNLHFDTRQYNMIDYGSPDDLQERLLNRILANLGKGPLDSN
jgi:nucleoside 2-deoxyribosyltransferase